MENQEVQEHFGIFTYSKDRNILFLLQFEIKKKTMNAVYMVQFANDQKGSKLKAATILPHHGCCVRKTFSNICCFLHKAVNETV